MHEVTIRVLLSTLILLAGATTTLFLHGPEWCFPLLIVLSLTVMTVTPTKASTPPDNTTASYENSEIGHANMPPEFDL